MNDYEITANTTHKKPYLIIKPKKGWQVVDLKELFQYSDLFLMMVYRDIKTRYRQTILGGLWVIIQPLFSMVVFGVIFGKLAKVPSDGVPYPIFNFSALIAWSYFAGVLSSASNSLIASGSLTSKVYFPRLILPLTPSLSGLMDFSFAFIILLVLALYYHIYPNIAVVFVPFLILLMMLLASGVGMFFAALSAKYRDISHVIPFFIQLWMFVSPIVYPLSLIPEKYRLIYSLNPMTGILEGFRSALLGTVSFPTTILLISTAVSIILFLAGLWYFKQTERYFADIL